MPSLVIPKGTPKLDVRSYQWLFMEDSPYNNNTGERLLTFRQQAHHYFWRPHPHDGTEFLVVECLNQGMEILSENESAPNFQITGLKKKPKGPLGTETLMLGRTKMNVNYHTINHSP